MQQEFSVTWIDIVIVLVPFLALGIRYFLRRSDIAVHKAFDVLLHPAAVLIIFVLLAINLSHL